jgi:periplasmic protein CpxP/Spy
MGNVPQLNSLRRKCGFLTGGTFTPAWSTCIFPSGEEHSILIDFRHFMIAARRMAPVFGLSIACCCVAWAQPDGPGGPPPDGGPPPGEMQQNQRGPSVDRQLKRLTQLLTLTADQQTQVKAILTDEHQQMEALFKSAAKSGKAAADTAASEDQLPSREEMEARRAAMKTIRTDTQAKIAALLTDDQKTKFAAWEKKRAKASAQQENGDDAPPPPPDGEGGPPPDGGGGPGGGGPGGF